MKKKKKKILINRAYCRNCHDEIESKSTHDFQSCSCKRIFVDGGKDYLRRGGACLIDTSVVI